MRLAVLIPGAARGLQPVKHQAFLDALAGQQDEVALWDVELARTERFLLALQSFAPNRNAWRSRFHARPQAFEARSRAAARLAATRPAVDAILQIGLTLDAGPAARAAGGARLAIFTDYSVVLTRDMGREWRLNLSEAEIAQRVAQEARALASARHVFVRSQLVANALIEAHGLAPDRVTVVGGGPGILPVGPRAPSPRLLFFGREFRRKGGDLVLAAFATLRARHPEVEIDIVAPRSEHRPLPGVLWHAPSRPDEVASLLGRASILLMPSRFETWGDAVVEAMAGGAVPVIANLPPMTEIVTDGVTGLVVPPEDPGALATAAERLLVEPDLARRLGQAAARHVADHLTQEKVAGRILAGLRKMP